MSGALVFARDTALDHPALEAGETWVPGFYGTVAIRPFLTDYCPRTLHRQQAQDTLSHSVKEAYLLVQEPKEQASGLAHI